MNWQNRRKQFRAQLNSDQCVFPASVFDPISARIAEDLGYEIGMFAGSIASLTVLGDPDLILLTLSEFAEQAYRISRAATLPLMVDADHGYGNALNVKRTVEELENAGVSGLSIEDTLLPRPYGNSKTTLISIEEGVGKMRAAIAGRQDPLLSIAARTSAVSVNGIEDAVARIMAYQQTGVDAIFLIGVKQKDQLDAIAKVCELPLILGGVGPDVMDKDYLSSMGVRICLQGHQPFMAAVQAVYQTMQQLREGVDPQSLQGIVDPAQLSKWSRKNEFDSLINQLLE